MEEIQPGIYREGNRLYTVNAVPSEDVYGEKLLDKEGDEFRTWNPNRSKAAAAVLNGVDLEIGKTDEILYLGAASGTTVSHFSDIVDSGFIYAVEYSDTVARDLVSLSEKRENIAPLLADARKPEEYDEYMDEVDVVFQDISQQDQAEIFAKNAERFMADDGVGLLSVKARSISSARDAEDIFDEVRQKLRERFEIVGETELEPYEKEHLFLKLKKKEGSG
ncbi:MAG: fibrillarin-like rRNA/tRNA 2'-O-methyltransferase [Candidatus Nanohaloarchaea archaeon]